EGGGDALGGSGGARLVPRARALPEREGSMEGLLGTPVHQAGIRSANKVTLTPCCQGKTVREGDLMKKPTCRFPGRSAPVVPQELLRAGVGRVQHDRQEEVFAGEGALPFLAEQFAQVGVGPGEVGLVADRGAQGGEGAGAVPL